MLLLLLMMMNRIVVRVNVNFEQGGILWVDNDICCEEHVERILKEYNSVT